MYCTYKKPINVQAPQKKFPPLTKEFSCALETHPCMYVFVHTYNGAGNQTLRHNSFKLKKKKTEYCTRKKIQREMKK